MTKRTISWLLCLMMVVSLFAGTLTSASAANGSLTIDPPSAVIYQTGSAAFTVSTMLDSLLDRIGSDKNFDLERSGQEPEGRGSERQHADRHAQRRRLQLGRHSRFSDRQRL